MVYEFMNGCRDFRGYKLACLQIAWLLSSKDRFWNSNWAEQSLLDWMMLCQVEGTAKTQIFLAMLDSGVCSDRRAGPPIFESAWVELMEKSRNDENVFRSIYWPEHKFGCRRHRIQKFVAINNIQPPVLSHLFIQFILDFGFLHLVISMT